MLKIILCLILFYSCVNAQTVMWGAAIGSYTSSQSVLEIPGKIGIAAKQGNICTVIINSSSVPTNNLVTALSDWITVRFDGNLGTNYYYTVSIPTTQQNPSSSRKGFFQAKLSDSSTPRVYEFTQSAGDIEVVEGASFSHSKLRAGAVLSAFGRNLSNRTLNADSLPLPYTLNNLSVYTTYRSSATTEKLPFTESKLFFVSPSQVNFIQTPSLAPTVKSEVCYWIWDSFGNLHSYLARTADAGGNFQPSPIASIFSKSSDGKGVPAAYLQICHHGMCENQEIELSLAGTGIQIGNNWWKPIELPQNKNAYLNLYVTGLRINSTFAEDVQVVLNDSLIITPNYVGNSGYEGVEQVQFLIPAGLAGINSAVRVKIRTKYLDSYYNGNIEWSSELLDFTTSGEIRNLIYLPIK